MKKVKKIILLIFLFIIMMIMKDKVYAASASISASNTSITTGATTNITVSVNSTEAWDLKLSASGGSLGGTTAAADAAGMEVSQSVMSATFSASSAGTYTITLSGEITGSDLVKSNVSGKSVTITVTDSSSGNSGNSGDSGSSGSGNTGNSGGGTTVSAPVLTNLGITPHDFSGFKSGTTSYSVTVPNDCKSVTIYANSNNGSITGTGAVTLKEGTNKFTVTVTNSAGSKSYTLSIIRETQDSDIIPNTIDGEEETEDTSEGIGLTGLRISGFNFEEEFQTGTYEYTVKIPEGLTEADLEEIKNSITAITNTDAAYVEIETQLNEDGSAVITLKVKDDEKEYATYTINFVIDDSLDEENAVAVAGTTKSNNSSGGGTTLEDMTKKMYIILGCLGVAIFFAVFFAANSYIKSKRLAKYEPDEKEEFKDENNLISSIYAETQGNPLTSLNYKDLTNNDNNEEIENNEEKDNKVGNKISEMLKDDSKIPEYPGTSDDSEIIDSKPNTLGRIKDTRDKLNDLSSYRKFRRGFSSGGKH